MQSYNNSTTGRLNSNFGGLKLFREKYSANYLTVEKRGCHLKKNSSIYASAQDTP